MSDTQLPALKPYHPTTFQERGVAVPFTTPLLEGTRARPTDKERVELVIPNPSGGRGVYIMPWKAIADWCRPTLHDAVFNDRIAALHNVTPAAIRRVGLQIAAEGLAGEEALEAARAAVDMEKDDRIITNYRLLMTLVEQVRARFSLPAFVKAPGKIDVMAQAKLTVDWISPRLGQTATWTASALETLSDVLLNVGVDIDSPSGRLPRILGLLRQTRNEIAEWNKDQHEDDHADYISMICTVMDLTLKMAETTLKQAQALTTDMIDLLRKWAADSHAVSRLAMRPEWLLDGREQNCLIWASARDDAERRAPLVEIIGLIPVLPKEAGEWSETPLDLDTALRFRRLVSLNEDWRSGALVFQLIARNEHFRAVTCRVPPPTEQAAA
jgi:hypothetical protein